MKDQSTRMSFCLGYCRVDIQNKVTLAEAEELKQILAPWKDHGSRGKQRADSDKDTFSIK